MDGFGTDDMAIPELKLVQNVGGDEAKAAGAVPGDLYLSLTEEIFKEGLNIVIVDMQKTRTYWGRSEIEDEPPECVSLDADSMMSADGLTSCRECEHRCDAPWLLDATERRAKCLVDYNILAIKFDSGMPLLVRAGGISSKAARELITQLRLNRELKGEYHRALVAVSSLPKKTPSGDAFALNFHLKELITDEPKVLEMKNLTIRYLGTSLALPQGAAEPELLADPVAAPVVPTEKPAKEIIRTPEQEEAHKNYLNSLAEAGAKTPPAGEGPGEAKQTTEGEPPPVEKPAETPEQLDVQF